MAQAQSIPKVVADLEGHNPGGDAFLLPDVSDIASGWIALAMQNAQTWRDEMTGFMTRRFEQDQATWAQLAACRNPIDLMKVQQDWFARSLEAYAEEGRRCSAIAASPAATAAKSKAPGKVRAFS